MPIDTEIIYTETHGKIPFTIVGTLVWGRAPYATSPTGDITVYHCPLCPGHLVFLLPTHEHWHAERGDLARFEPATDVPCGCRGDECFDKKHPLLPRQRVCRKGQV
jgi:hypothetical protein